jgi:hypothetical protein
MRTRPHFAAGAALACAALGAWLVGAGAMPSRPGPAHAVSPRRAEAPAQPTPAPRLLPMAMVHFDARAPEPVTGRAQGTLLPLTTQGRGACAPATHLLAKDDTLPPQGVALAYALDPSNPTTELDLYFGAYVEIRGPEMLAPAGCGLAPKVIAVSEVDVLDAPGTALPPAR